MKGPRITLGLGKERPEATTQGEWGMWEGMGCMEDVGIEGARRNIPFSQNPFILSFVHCLLLDLLKRDEESFCVEDLLQPTFCFWHFHVQLLTHLPTVL